MEIYKTINTINKKFYIGKDTGVNGENYLGSGTLLHRAIVKYGRDNFYRETIETCDTKEQLSEREIYWIEKLDACKSKNSYNISTGGSGGDTLTHHPHYKEICKKVSDGQMGKRHTDSRKRNISNALKNSIKHKKMMQSKEYRDKMSIVLSGENNPRSILTDELVIEILRKYESKITIQRIAEEYGISVVQAGKIKRNQAWKHIDRKKFNIPFRRGTNEFNKK